jgi:hypothetical protein
VFATDEVVALWPPITLANTPELVEKANNMTSRKIGLNLEFRDAVEGPKNAT